MPWLCLQICNFLQNNWRWLYFTLIIQKIKLDHKSKTVPLLTQYWFFRGGVGWQVHIRHRRLRRQRAAEQRWEVQHSGELLGESCQHEAPKIRSHRCRLRQENLRNRWVCYQLFDFYFGERTKRYTNIFAALKNNRLKYCHLSRIYAHCVNSKSV